MTTPAIHCLHDAVVPLTDLREHPRNPNRHTQKQSDLLARIIEKTGWRNCIIVSRRSGFIVAGHGRLYAARTLRLENVPVQYQDFESEEEELRHLVADNRLAEFSSRDDAALASILKELQDEGALSLTGYDDSNVAKLLARLASDESTGGEDTAVEPNAELAAKWGTAPGQVWLLGQHRLVIGDSREASTWGALMGNEKAALVFTDPPFGVDYVDSKGRRIEGDDLKRDDLSDLIHRSFEQALRHTTDDCPFYVWHASSTRDDFTFALKSVGLVERQYITWVKEGFVLGHEDYHWQTEHAFYLAREGARQRWCGDRSQSTVWCLTGQAPAAGVLTTKDGIVITDGKGRYMLVKETAPPKAASKLRHFRVPAGESLVLQPPEPTTAWRVSRDPVAEYVHPNQKPPELAAIALKNSTQPGEVVVDFFAGSGSTLIACEQHRRVARCADKDPLYAAAIIERWHNLTKKAPRLAA